ncbi:MAG TPA: CaiB/BaiF CoA-transferase family protein [Methylomirabilota bacterium]|nr:CaiB/BaiF CoA-transferase family protein [Methylomirabilota bacterium]
MLSAYRVLDLTTERGLLCGQILGDLGADVIKIEPPGGSPARRLGPFYQDQPHPDRSLLWWAYNRNKRSVTLDITKHEGKELLRRLVATAHFLIESDNPGAMTQLGLGYEDLAAINPGLIYVSISAFGQDGPKAHYADSDLVILAAGGPLILYGDSDRAPLRLSVPQAYLHACLEGAVAALLANHERHRSGLGQHIDVSAQQAVALATQAYILAAPYGEAEIQRMAGGVKIGPLNIRLLWPAKDGYVAITYLFGTAFGHFTKRLMDWIYEEGLCDENTHNMDWVRFGGELFAGGAAIATFERLKLIVEDFTKTKTKAELLQGALQRTLLIAPISTIDEVVNSPQLTARNYWQEMTHPELGQTFRYPGPFVKFSETPITYRCRPPLVGEHNREIYVDELGLTEQRVMDLQSKGVI